MQKTKRFGKDFILVIIGQIISLFGNAILRFALSLYVLDTTGSAAVFGGILAVSMVPTILCSPLGGVLADRVPRQRIMWGLDFFTAARLLGETGANSIAAAHPEAQSARERDRIRAQIVRDILGRERRAREDRSPAEGRENQ